MLKDIITIAYGGFTPITQRTISRSSGKVITEIYYNIKHHKNRPPVATSYQWWASDFESFCNKALRQISNIYDKISNTAFINFYCHSKDEYNFSSALCSFSALDSLVYIVFNAYINNNLPDLLTQPQISSYQNKLKEILDLFPNNIVSNSNKLASSIISKIIQPSIKEKWNYVFDHYKINRSQKEDDVYRHRSAFTHSGKIKNNDYYALHLVTEALLNRLILAVCGYHKNYCYYTLQGPKQQVDVSNPPEFL
ncbi:MAG: hypothetical protein GF403_11785 [Candidatus Coatesbacteria bacterium]|nr:hypothetical protein [Candidatus Coatesbacteria bacterium]